MPGMEGPRALARGASIVTQDKAYLIPFRLYNGTFTSQGTERNALRNVLTGPTAHVGTTAPFQPGDEADDAPACGASQWTCKSFNPLEHAW